MIGTSDATLAEGLAVNLDGHFEPLVLHYQDRLYGFALRLIGNPAEAEDCVQDAFVRAYRALRRYPSERRRALHLQAWLYRITLNVVRNRVRGPRSAPVALDGAVAERLAAPASEQPELAAESAERRRDLARRVAALPERYRAGVVLRHVQGLAYAEVAAILGQPVGTTKANVHRGLRLLRAGLETTSDAPNAALVGGGNLA